MSFLDHPNVKALLAEAHNEYDDLPTEVSMADKIIQEKILHILDLYPSVSPAMLQVGIGTSIPPAIWKPYLDMFIKSGIVIKREETRATPTGRFINYTFLEMSPLVVTEPPEAKPVK